MLPPAQRLRDLLFSLTVQVREIRALSLVDGNGLPLVSTLGPGSLDEALAAFGGAASRQMERCARDFEMGPMYVTHLVGRDRQLFATPVEDEISLVAIVEAGATPATVVMHLLALARQIVAAEPVTTRGDDSPQDP